ncbi:MAG: hypothetical protein C3F11_04405 [Methylocystaceae bacterium]|nr:MAG: hypothetical protein C3F11_04405 [Methylocystaceae bacterium]
MLCISAFPTAPLLPSIRSASARADLFADFIGTISESDFSVPYITGFGLRPSLCGPSPGWRGRSGDLSVPVRETYAHARV